MVALLPHLTSVLSLVPVVSASFHGSTTAATATQTDSSDLTPTAATQVPDRESGEPRTRSVDVTVMGSGSANDGSAERELELHRPCPDSEALASWESRMEMAGLLASQVADMASRNSSSTQDQDQDQVGGRPTHFAYI